MKEYEIVKVGRKWSVEGEGRGWIFDRTFPTKWKCETALEVFREGGRVSDCWERAREEKEKRPERIPWKRIKEIEPLYERIRELEPNGEEIVEFGETLGYGEITSSKSQDYFGPRLHNTWGTKSRGHVHIDIGCFGHHLMLGDDSAKNFIEFIEKKRGIR